MKYTPIRPALLFFLIASFLFSLSALRADGRISGKVIDAGNPLEGALIELLSGNNEKIAEALTDSSGAYELSGIPQGRYLVKASFPDYLPVSTNPLPVDLENSDKSRANFSLGFPGSIAGQVIKSKTGEPLSNALVEVMRGNVVLASAFTDEEGNYRIDHLAPRPYIVRVNMETFESDMRLAVPQSSKLFTLNFALEFPPGKITGRVVNEATGEPLFNAIVDIFTLDLAMIDSIQTNPDGSYLSAELPEGSYLVRARAAGFDISQEVVTLESSQSLTFNFSLHLLGNVEGRVVAKSTGKPLVGVAIGFWQNNQLIASSRTDATGFFRLEGIKEGHLIAQFPSFLDAELRVFAGSGETVSIEMALERKAPTPPKRVVASLSKKKSSKPGFKIYYVKWRESADPSVVSYRIYRNGKRVGEVSSGSEFVFKDQCKPGKSLRYEVTAVNEVGQESAPTLSEEE